MNLVSNDDVELSHFHHVRIERISLLASVWICPIISKETNKQTILSEVDETR